MARGRTKGSARALTRDRMAIMETMFQRVPLSWTDLIEKLGWDREKNPKKVTRALKDLTADGLIKKEDGLRGHYYLTSNGRERFLEESFKRSYKIPRIPVEVLETSSRVPGFQQDLAYISSEYIKTFLMSGIEPKRILDVIHLESNGRIAANVVFNKEFSDTLVKVAKIYQGDSVDLQHVVDALLNILEVMIAELSDGLSKKFLTGKAFIPVQFLIKYDVATKNLVPGKMPKHMRARTT